MQVVSMPVALHRHSAATRCTLFTAYNQLGSGLISRARNQALDLNVSLNCWLGRGLACHALWVQPRSHSKIPGTGISHFRADSARRVGSHGFLPLVVLPFLSIPANHPLKREKLNGFYSRRSPRRVGPGVWNRLLCFLLLPLRDSAANFRPPQRHP